MEPKKALTLAADLWGPVVPLWIEFVPTHWVNTFGCYVIANWCKMRPSPATSLIRRVKIKMEVKDTQSISDHSLPKDIKVSACVSWRAVWKVTLCKLLILNSDRLSQEEQEAEERCR